ncbi:hypothetical protein PTKIN_Ptkin07bG0270500 [Pterospermum kingtungense]
MLLVPSFLLELLTGRHPSRMLDGGREYHQLGMLTEVARVCSLTSPEQRPAMWQVLKMVQEIKESACNDGG